MKLGKILKGLSLILIIGAVVAVIVVLTESKLPAQNNTAQNNTLVNTSNWKVYRNEKYHFQIKYPKDLIIKEIISMLEETADTAENAADMFRTSVCAYLA